MGNQVAPGAGGTAAGALVGATKSRPGLQLQLTRRVTVDGAQGLDRGRKFEKFERYGDDVFGVEVPEGFVLLRPGEAKEVTV